MNKKFISTIICASLFVITIASDAAEERHRLYTHPDPSASGGIKGTIVSPKMPIFQIFAMPPDEPSHVYLGTVSGSSKKDFEFHGLPMGKYDLFVLFENSFYEGLELNRGENTLTSKDIEKIDYIVKKSNVFYNKKVIHRAEGITGRGNFARCIATYLRDERVDEGLGGTGYIAGFTKRTFKLVQLKDVGPGWQIVMTRDIFPKMVDKKFGLPKHHFTSKLSRIRVTNYVKDLNEINLSK